MGEPPRGISSNSNHSNISIFQREYDDRDRKLNIKRAQTLKQNPADRVIEEGSDFDDSGSGFASDTPVAGLKRHKVDTFGEAMTVPKKRKLKKHPIEENTSYKIISISQSNIKGMSAAGSAYDSNKKRVKIA